MANRVLVSGSRHGFSGCIEFVFQQIEKQIGKIDTLIEGGAKGVDRQCRNFALEKSMRVVTVEAEWEKYGKGAGDCLRRLKKTNIMTFLVNETGIIVDIFNKRDYFSII